LPILHINSSTSNHTSREAATFNQQMHGYTHKSGFKYFFGKYFSSIPPDSLIDSIIIRIRKFCCDQKSVHRWRKLSSLFKERQAFHQDFVAPAVEACAIVASDCLQRSRHSSPCHIPSEASPTGQAFRGTHIMCNRPPDQARQQRQ